MITKIGTVTSVKMNKTIKVQVVRRSLHPIYKKYTNKFTTLFAHDEDNRAELGDQVLLSSSRPISKLKYWVLKEIINKK